MFSTPPAISTRTGRTSRPWREVGACWPDPHMRSSVDQVGSRGSIARNAPLTPAFPTLCNHADACRVRPQAPFAAMAMSAIRCVSRALRNMSGPMARTAWARRRAPPRDQRSQHTRRASPPMVASSGHKRESSTSRPNHDGRPGIAEALQAGDRAATRPTYVSTRRGRRCPEPEKRRPAPPSPDGRDRGPTLADLGGARRALISRTRAKALGHRARIGGTALAGGSHHQATGPSRPPSGLRSGMKLDTTLRDNEAFARCGLGARAHPDMNRVNATARDRPRPPLGAGGKR